MRLSRSYAQFKSRSTVANPCGSSASLRSIVTTPQLQNRDPSRLTRHRSSAARPSRRAVPSSASKAPCSLASDVNRMAPDWPSASASVYPSSRSAPGFQPVIHSISRSRCCPSQGFGTGCLPNVLPLLAECRRAPPRRLSPDYQSGGARNSVRLSEDARWRAWRPG